MKIAVTPKPRDEQGCICRPCRAARAITRATGRQVYLESDGATAYVGPDAEPVSLPPDVAEFLRPGREFLAFRPFEFDLDIPTGGRP